MKLTLTNIRTIKRNSENPLEKYVCNYVINEWHDYDDKTNIFKDVLYHGCQSGVVGALIWYSQTTAFYKKYRNEINELLKELMDSTGLYSMKELFGKNWDGEDPLILDTHNQNLLAWFGFEETLRNIGLNFEQLQDYI